MKDIHDQTFYELLEVEPTATQEEILKAYNRARATYGHNSPALYSLFNKEEAQELLKLIDEAYAVLSNQFKRRQYDTKAHVGPSPTGAAVHDLHEKSQKPLAGPGDFAIPSAATMPGFSEIMNFHEEPSKEPATNKSRGADKEKSSPQPSKKQEPASQTPSTQAKTATVTLAATPTPSPVGTIKPPTPGATSFGNYKIDPLFEDELKRTDVFSGAVLQKIRLYKNITIDQISESTKISRPYLIAIEAGNFTSLPAPVFVRGFVVQIAKILGIDSTKAANSFVNLLKESQKK